MSQLISTDAFACAYPRRGNWSCALALLFALTLCGAATASRADGISEEPFSGASGAAICPETEASLGYTQCANGGTATDTTGSRIDLSAANPDSGYSVGSSASAQALIGDGAQLDANAVAGTGQGTPVSAYASIYFEVEVLGPALSPGIGVPILMDGTASTSVPGGAGVAYYGFDLGSSYSTAISSTCGSGSPVSPEHYACPEQSIDMDYYIIPNTASDASYWVYALADAGSDVDANIDPTLTIDPNWAYGNPALYTLEIFDGGSVAPPPTGSVPEPDSFFLFAFALGLLWLGAGRSSRHTRRPDGCRTH